MTTPCTKEVELAKMIVTLTDIADDIKELKVDVSKVRDSVLGNGHDGLTTKVKVIENILNNGKVITLKHVKWVGFGVAIALTVTGILKIDWILKFL